MYWEEAVDYYESARKFNGIESEEKQKLLEAEKIRREEIREKRRNKLLVRCVLWMFLSQKKLLGLVP